MAAVSPIDTPETEQPRTFYERDRSASGGLGVLNVFKEAIMDYLRRFVEEVIPQFKEVKASG